MSDKVKKIELEEAFEGVAERAIEEAELIDCEFDQFVEGLRTMTSMFKTRLSQAIDEQGSRTAGDDDGDEGDD